MGAAGAGAFLSDLEIDTLYEDLLPYMRSVGAVPDSIMPGAAQWLSERTFEISSLDPGPINFVEPWGGSEFGHSYTFALTPGGGAPASVSLDPDTGLLATSTTLAPGAYTFPVVVKNMKDISKVSTFWITIAVREGVASNRTGYQVLHKNYNVDIPGPPTDWATRLLTLRKTIVDDQTAAGDNNFCAGITFTAGATYNYSDNRWTFGIQRLKVRSNLPGTPATLCCIYDPPPPPEPYPDLALCSLQLGRGWASNTSPPIPGEDPPPYNADASKLNAYFINTATAGSTTVTLKTAGDAANFVVGRWVVVASYDQQGHGFPANARYTDYAKVASKNGAVITLDRKLRWTHRDNYWEDTSNTNSLGKARLIAVDRDPIGGVGCRATLRVHMQDIVFALNPNTPLNSARKFFYAEGLEQYFKNVTAYNFCISQSRHAHVDSCMLGSSELDKLSTRFVMNGGDSTLETTDGLSSATGVELVLLKNVDSVSGSILCPRQLRVIGGALHGVENRPWSVGPWQTWHAWFKGVTFTRVATSTDSAFRVYTPLSFVTIGTEGVTYASGVLTTPTNLDGAIQWISVRDTAFEGCLVYVGSLTSGRNGYITSIARNSTDTAILYSITWLNGSAPGAGDVVYTTVAHEVFVDSTCVAGTNTNFQAIDMVSKETIEPTPPTIPPRAFPAGYPASIYGF